ncbi:Mediator of RNA polymerase II transcription subunit 34 [Exaiptasia diaphana]|nr:Mediator of RNA polymerase II transcription subunit 34 [Exaiptasia diaphana]
MWNHYCIERRETIDLTYHLRLAGVNAVFFHAGMDASEKQQSIQSWKHGATHVMCATVAFGMGIDKKDVNFVVHHSIPKDLESYAQESGRPGRNGSEAHCLIFFRFEDRTKHLRNIAALPDSERKHVCLNGLNDIVKYCITPTCRRKQIVQYFDNNDPSGDLCNHSCNICVKNASVQPVDRSDDAIQVLKCLESMQQIEPNVTIKIKL